MIKFFMYRYRISKVFEMEKMHKNEYGGQSMAGVKMKLYIICVCLFIHKISLKGLRMEISSKKDLGHWGPWVEKRLFNVSPSTM